MRILILGGSGKLGRELTKILNKSHKLCCPSHSEADVSNIDSLSRIKFSTNIVVNCAALVGIGPCEKNQELAFNINSVGAGNSAEFSQNRGAHLIQISTDSVFDGEKGNYRESDRPNPISNYGYTKYLGELYASEYPNVTIIRMSFFPTENFKYDTIPTNQYMSREPIHITAGKIKEFIEAEDKEWISGIWHIGCKRRSHYEIIKEYYPNIKPTTVEALEAKLGQRIPGDLSLDTHQYDKYFNGAYYGN